MNYSQFQESPIGTPAIIYWHRAGSKYAPQITRTIKKITTFIGLLSLTTNILDYRQESLKSKAFFYIE